MSIYFVQNERTKAVKIGYSGNVKSRLKTLRTSSADSLRLLGTIAGNRVDEHRLHLTFAKHRLNGEWFTPADELVHSIQWLLANRGGGKPTTTATPPAHPTLTEVCDLMSCCVAEADRLLSSSCDLKFHVSAIHDFDDEAYLAIGGTPSFHLMLYIRDPETGACAISTASLGDSANEIQTRLAEMVADIASQNSDCFNHCVKV